MSQSSSRQQVVWAIESSHPQLIESLQTELRKVVDPEIGLNIIELGLVRDVTLQNGAGTVYMIMTTPFCPYGPA